MNKEFYKNEHTFFLEIKFDTCTGKRKTQIRTMTKNMKYKNIKLQLFIIMIIQFFFQMQKFHYFFYHEMLPNEACKRKTSSDYKSYKVNLCMVEKLLHDAHHGEFTYFMDNRYL